MKNKNDENYVYYLVGQNLKRIRRSKNMTITKLAVESTYSKGFISNIEAPNYLETFSIGVIWKFAEVLDVDIREFFRPLD